jgi:glycosyltransferase involved in cell wall biosynthesis
MNRARALLIVSYHYLPFATPGSRRVDSVARRLAERGWKVTILTAAAPRDAAPEAPHPVEVIRTARVPVAAVRGTGPAIAAPPRGRLGRALSFPDKYAGWLPSLLRGLAELLSTRSFDVVFTSSPPHSSQFAVALARARRRFRWVAEFRDPWMFPRRRPLNRASAWAQERMERYVLMSCDRVIANTDGNRTALLAAMPRLAPGKVVVVPNGFDAVDFTGPAPPRSDADLTYVGEIYPGMLAMYADVLSTLRERSPGSVPVLELFGTVDPREQRRLEERGLDAFVSRHGFVSHGESIRAMRAARALLVLLPPGERWATCVPSKVYWYLAARRPVIAMVPEGDAARVVRGTGAGWTITDTEPARAAEALAGALARSRAWDGGPNSTTAAAEYEIDAIVDRLEAVLREASDGPAR